MDRPQLGSVSLLNKALVLSILVSMLFHLGEARSFRRDQQNVDRKFSRPRREAPLANDDLDSLLDDDVIDSIVDQMYDDDHFEDTEPEIVEVVTVKPLNPVRKRQHFNHPDLIPANPRMADIANFRRQHVAHRYSKDIVRNLTPYKMKPFPVQLPQTKEKFDYDNDRQNNNDERVEFDVVFPPRGNPFLANFRRYKRQIMASIPVAKFFQSHNYDENAGERNPELRREEIANMRKDQVTLRRSLKNPVNLPLLLRSKPKPSTAKMEKNQNPTEVPKWKNWKDKDVVFVDV